MTGCEQEQGVLYQGSLTVTCAVLVASMQGPYRQLVPPIAQVLVREPWYYETCARKGLRRRERF